ncbi:MAG: nucleotidyltransferase family protein [Lachnospiraceae bacterium]|nr:nucleotidyltransferase family protein [Lachnospiraceae bacterium]
MDASLSTTGRGKIERLSMGSQTEALFFRIIRAVIDGEDALQIPADTDFSALYSLSAKHDLAHLVGYALDKHKVDVPRETRALFRKQYTLAVFRDVKRSAAINEIRTLFRSAGIPFILLKGAVLLDLYPESWMRTSCDVDILVRKDDFDQVVNLCLSTGMTQTFETEHDVSFNTNEEYHIEIHHTLLDEGKTGFSELQDVWDASVPAADGECEHIMSDEMFYFYHIAHMVKHLQDGGCGVRPFLDLWLLNHIKEFDPEKRQKLLERGGLSLFAAKASELSEVWFSGETANEDMMRFGRYIMDGGVYGTKKQAIAQKKTKGESRYQYYKNRVFQPYDQIKHNYPILKKAPVLLPAVWVVRWFKVLDPKTRARVKYEVESERDISDNEVEQVSQLMKQLGL